MFDLPDAPDIARTMRTGYPYPEERQMCEKCGEEVATRTSITHGNLCTSCALLVWNELTDEEKLDLLGFDYL